MSRRDYESPAQYRSSRSRHHRQYIALYYDHRKESFYLAPRLDSVFDIANYSLLRMMATNAPNLDFGDSKTAVSICESCGKMFVKTGNRQEVCSNEECQKALNAAAFRQRWKLKDGGKGE